MTIVRVLALVAVVVLCGGFIPVGGCAKGCGKVASSGGDDVVRTGARYSDDLAISSSRYGAHSADDLARYGHYTPPRGGAVVAPGTHAGDDFAHLSSSNLESAVAALPEAEGAAAALAKRPTSSGARLDGVNSTRTRTFGSDYARTIDDLKLTKKQHEQLMDAFETAQSVLEEAIGNLADDDEDGKDARLKLELTSMELEAQLAQTLTPEQHQLFREKLGSSEVVAYRLARERPVKRDGKRKTE